LHQICVVDIETLDLDTAGRGFGGGSELGRGAALRRNDVPTVRSE
jgi:hypothetical protein